MKTKNKNTDCDLYLSPVCFPGCTEVEIVVRGNTISSDGEVSAPWPHFLIMRKRIKLPDDICSFSIDVKKIKNASRVKNKDDNQ